ncbi:hypothetical protein PAAG_07411 [Paracoccidioides lutzii Pb01]|uniref:Mediator of RNA polymerase II transcription subunit 9 n=1 Tax=Paracoccidioides lutzii (strain ATCC MYA-826 / Pb01) TaxID=502779 RepID=C1H9H0_PARBA|nr:hypothetical protein PAAG_07411 [Paracoccidioides lutzii Pb01]EEH36993.1 hypothetical protein PAAG_07411 [Paracoccidioides lutzii Pb01]
MTSSRTPTSASIPSLKIPSLQSSTSASSPVTPTLHQQLQQQDSTIPAETSPFPPPQTFDIIPPLHDLLLRLASNPSNQHQQQAEAGGGSGVGPPPPPAPPHSANATATRSTAIDTTAVAFLDPKVLLSEASGVKIRIQKAKAALEGLPDMQRGVEEQEEEIAELEESIERLREVIGEFGRRSRGVTEDVGIGGSR